MPVPRPPSSQGEPQEPKKPGCGCDGNCCPCCPCKPKVKPEEKPETPTPGKVEITDEHLGKIADIIIKRMKENPEPWKGEPGKDGRDGNDGKDGVNGKSSESFGIIVEFEGKGGRIKRRLEIGNGDTLVIPPSRFDIYDGGKKFSIEEALGDPISIEITGDLSAEKRTR